MIVIIMAGKFRSDAQRKAVMAELARRKHTVVSNGKVSKKLILDTIDKYDDGDGAFITDIVKDLKAKVPEADVRKMLESLIDEGIIYFPQWFSSDRVKVL